MIIGLAGGKGSGKSTVAEIVKKLRHRTKIIHLAEPLKDFAAKLFDFSHDQLHGPSELRDAVDERYGISPRKALQVIGTDACRALYENVWIDLGLRRAREALDGSIVRPVGSGATASWELELYDTVVIPDVRFLNEMEAIVAAGGEVWFKYGPGRGTADGHASELDMYSSEAELYYTCKLPFTADIRDLDPVVKMNLKHYRRAA